MIFNKTYQKAISNLGWVDKGGLWIYDGLTAQFKTIQLSTADYLVIRPGLEGYFSIVHSFKGSKVEVTIHHFRNPTEQLCKASFDSHRIVKTGELGYWQYVPKYYIACLNLNNNFNFHLLKIEDGLIYLEDDKISWFLQGDFDFGWQGLTGVLENKNELLFTVQRDGSLYRFDLAQNKIIERIQLAGNHGNPDPKITNSKEIWVVDYDTLLRIDLNSWEIIKSRKLQDAAAGTGQFIGDFSFNSDNSLCIVARPFSGDVIGVNKDLNIQCSCKTGKQPLKAVLMNNTVISRDWQTGEFMQGKMQTI